MGYEFDELLAKQKKEERKPQKIGEVSEIAMAKAVALRDSIMTTWLWEPDRLDLKISAWRGCL